MLAPGGAERSDEHSSEIHAKSPVTAAAAAAVELEADRHWREGG